MKIIQELNDQKLPIIRIENSLEKYKSMPIFQDQADNANEMIQTIGFPKMPTKS
jgi:hypothetical protein